MSEGCNYEPYGEEENVRAHAQYKQQEQQTLLGIGGEPDDIGGGGCQAKQNKLGVLQLVGYLRGDFQLTTDDPVHITGSA
mgnify:CR=1 FL=1